jgi:hypothetical protein
MTETPDIEAIQQQQRMLTDDATIMLASQLGTSSVAAVAMMQEENAESDDGGEYSESTGSSDGSDSDDEMDDGSSDEDDGARSDEDGIENMSLSAINRFISIQQVEIRHANNVLSRLRKRKRDIYGERIAHYVEMYAKQHLVKRTVPEGTVLLHGGFTDSFYALGSTAVACRAHRNLTVAYLNVAHKGSRGNPSRVFCMNMFAHEALEHAVKTGRLAIHHNQDDRSFYLYANEYLTSAAAAATALAESDGDEMDETIVELACRLLRLDERTQLDGIVLTNRRMIFTNPRIADMVDLVRRARAEWHNIMGEQPALTFSQQTAAAAQTGHNSASQDPTNA